MVDGAVVERLAAVEEARRLRCDATSVVERMALRAHRGGLSHPVAAAVALSARVSRLAGLEDFAERIGVPAVRLVEAEAGAVRFGDLPAELDPVLAGLGLDLLALADLERELARAAFPGE